MNKYGGINDLHGCDSKVYRLWYSMLRRCYDKGQHARMRGKSYEDCEVCDRWKSLSNFVADIAELDGYGEWLTGSGYCLDKDTLNQGNKVYSKENCRFIPIAENIGDIHKRHPQNVEILHEKRKSRYRLVKGDEVIDFNSEKEAGEYLGVARCTVASCYHKGRKCKGYTVAKMDGGDE